MRIVTSIALAVVLTGCRKTTTVAPSTSTLAPVATTTTTTTKEPTNAVVPEPQVIVNPNQSIVAIAEDEIKPIVASVVSENGETVVREVPNESDKPITNVEVNSSTEVTEEVVVNDRKSDYDNVDGVARMFAEQPFNKNFGYERNADALLRLFSAESTKDRVVKEANVDIFADDNLGMDMRSLFEFQKDDGEVMRNLFDPEYEAEEEDDEAEGEYMRDMFNMLQETEGDVNFALPKGALVGNIVQPEANADIKIALETRARAIYGEMVAYGVDMEDIDEIEQEVSARIEAIRLAGFNRLMVGGVAIDLASYESYLYNIIPRIAGGVVQFGDYAFTE